MAPQLLAKPLPLVIPAEIWIHVAQFIPDTDLLFMSRVNSVFFQLSMDAKYRVLSLSVDSGAKALQRLRRVRDTSIAHRIRSLHMKLSNPVALYEKYNVPGKLNLEWPDISSWEEIKIMTETIASLTNVTEFSVEWVDCSCPEHLLPFLIVAWKTFGSGLRKLSFKVSLKYLAALLSTADGLVSLRDLDMKVNKKFADTGDETLATTLAPFINKVAPTLHSLSSDFVDLDITLLLHRVEKIPHLERLRLSVHNNTNLLTEPFRITHFICNHAKTLRHLDWDQSYGYSGEQHLIDFLHTGDNLEEVFSNLRTLRIAVPTSPGGFAMVVQHMRCSAPTLTSLDLSGYYMTFEDVNTVISLFTPLWARNLKELSFEVEFLSPELILLLAQTLPCLETLGILCLQVAGYEVDERAPEAINAGSPKNPMDEELLHAGIFADTLRTYDIRGWGLCDIEIDMRSWDIHLPKKLMWVLAECLPSVQTFRGEKISLHDINPDHRL